MKKAYVVSGVVWPVDGMTAVEIEIFDLAGFKTVEISDGGSSDHNTDQATKAD